MRNHRSRTLFLPAPVTYNSTSLQAMRAMLQMSQSILTGSWSEKRNPATRFLISVDKATCANLKAARLLVGKMRSSSGHIAAASKTFANGAEGDDEVPSAN